MRVPPARARRYYYGWNIIAICVLAQLSVIGIAFNCVSLFVPVWSKAFQAPPSELLLSVTIFTFLGPVLSPIAGWAADRLPANFVIGLGLLCSAAAYVAIAFANSAVALILLYVVVLSPGFIFATAIPTQAVVCRWFDRRRGFAMGMNALGVVLAGVMFPPLVVALLPHIGWRTIWIAAAALIGLLAAPLALLALYDRPPADDPFGYVDVVRKQTDTDIHSVWAILRRPNFWIVAAVYVASLSVYLSVTFNLGPIVLSHGFDLALAGILISLLSAADFGGKLLFGVLVDWLGTRIPLVLVALAAALAAIMLNEVSSRDMLFLAVIPLGLSGGIWTVLPASMANEFGSASFGRAFGLISMLTPLASLTAPVFAKLAERSGSYSQGLVALAAFAIVSALIGTLLKQAKPKAELRAAELH